MYPFKLGTKSLCIQTGYMALKIHEWIKEKYLFKIKNGLSPFHEEKNNLLTCMLIIGLTFLAIRFELYFLPANQHRNIVIEYTPTLIENTSNAKI